MHYRGQRRGMSAEPGSKGRGVGRVRVMSRGEVAQPLYLGGSQRRQVCTDVGGQASAGAEGDVEVSGVKGQLSSLTRTERELGSSVYCGCRGPPRELRS